MAEALQEFDPADPLNAIADDIRKAIAGVAYEAVTSPVYRSASTEAQVLGFVAGMMVGAVGAIIATMNEGTDVEVRSLIQEHLPYWFDRALELNQRDPIGEAN